MYHVMLMAFLNSFQQTMKVACEGSLNKQNGI
jgi:hypothetical protein